jgi:hypothetical protein
MPGPAPYQPMPRGTSRRAGRQPPRTPGSELPSRRKQPAASARHNGGTARTVPVQVLSLSVNKSGPALLRQMLARQLRDSFPAGRAMWFSLTRGLLHCPSPDTGTYSRMTRNICRARRCVAVAASPGMSADRTAMPDRGSPAHQATQPRMSRLTSPGLSRCRKWPASGTITIREPAERCCSAAATSSTPMQPSALPCR